MTLTLEATIQADGTLTLSVGEINPPDARYPLRGLPYRYDDPTEPVAADDWLANA